MFDLRRSTTTVLLGSSAAGSYHTLETMNTFDEEEMNQQLQKTKLMQPRRHSVGLVYGSQNEDPSKK